MSVRPFRGEAAVRYSFASTGSGVARGRAFTGRRRKSGTWSPRPMTGASSSRRGCAASRSRTIPARRPVGGSEACEEPRHRPERRPFARAARGHGAEARSASFAADGPEASVLIRGDSILRRAGGVVAARIRPVLGVPIGTLSLLGGGGPRGPRSRSTAPAARASLAGRRLGFIVLGRQSGRPPASRSCAR